jgi:hypothetical protein
VADVTEAQAELLAIAALGWLAANDELWPVFLAATGADADGARSRAGDPEFLGAVLDFLTQDDRWVVAFCDSRGLDYHTPLSARQALPGGANVHWT